MVIARRKAKGLQIPEFYIRPFMHRKGIHVALALVRIPPSIWQTPVEEMRTRFSFRKAPVLNRLRIALWKQLRRVKGSSQTLHPSDIYSGIASRHYFNKYVLRDPLKLVWLFSEPERLESIELDFYILAADGLRAILTAPKVKAYGRPHFTNLRLQLQATELLLKWKDRATSAPRHRAK